MPLPINITHKFTLTRHTKAINTLAISPGGSLLLSGGNDGHVVVWSLTSGEMLQEICVPSAGFISCTAWLKLADQDEDTFVFGASDGNIHLYQRSRAIESLAWDPQHRRLASAGNGKVCVWKFITDQKSFAPVPSSAEKQPYVVQSVHFLDDGSSIVVSYLESGYIFCYSIDPWDLKWKKKANGRIGDTFLDGQHLLISNLRDSVDKYTLPTLYHSQSYHHAILVNVPQQLAVTRESGLLIVGGDDGFAQIFDYQTGAFRDKLDHGSAGDLVVTVATFEGVQGCTIVTGSALEGHSNIKVWKQEQQRITANILHRSNAAAPLDSPDAWSLVLKWAEETIDIGTFTISMSQKFGPRYIEAEWRDIMTSVFLCWENKESASTVVVAAMEARGVVLPSSDLSIEPSTSKSQSQPLSHRRKQNRDSGQATSRSLRKRARKMANQFLDVEAQVDEGEESEDEEEDAEGFIIPDANTDMGTSPQRRPVMPHCMMSTSSSRFKHVINEIAGRYVDGTTNEHSMSQPDNSDSDDQSEEVPQSPPPAILDTAGIWESIRDWMFGSLNYEKLMDILDSQYDHNPNIQYWEDFLSTLTFLLDLGEISVTHSPAGTHQDFHRAPPCPSSPSLLPNDMEQTLMWVVNIIPSSSVDFIVKAWNQAGLTATLYKNLPHRSTVCAVGPSTFLLAVPVSHISCVCGWSLVPFEDRISLSPVFGCSEPPLPGWYTISKHGMYKGDVAYGLSFEGESGELRVLIASQTLKPPKCWPGDDIGQAHHARRLFSPNQFRGKQLVPYHGWSHYEYKKETYISGLLLISLRLNQVAPLPTPTPHQIALHVASMVSPAFMTTTYQTYNQQFWKENDIVVVSNSAYFEKHGVLLEIEHASCLARVYLLLEGEEFSFPLSNLHRKYVLGDVV
ncbi:WD40-repeat-containing domain protein [Boletus coccyginus]|nr:WD40-repeat-containing domain protein [Boletus coccyginus]